MLSTATQLGGTCTQERRDVGALMFPVDSVRLCMHIQHPNVRRSIQNIDVHHSLYCVQVPDMLLADLRIRFQSSGFAGKCAPRSQCRDNHDDNDCIALYALQRHCTHMLTLMGTSLLNNRDDRCNHKQQRHGCRRKPKPKQTHHYSNLRMARRYIRAWT